MKQQHKEAKMQESCIRWFRYAYPDYKLLLFASANGGSRNVMEAVNLKRQGVLSGVSDLQLAMPNAEFNGFFLELKIAPNKPSLNQLLFMEAVESQNYKTAVIYSFDEFKEEIDNYLS